MRNGLRLIREASGGLIRTVGDFAVFTAIALVVLAATLIAVPVVIVGGIVFIVCWCVRHFFLS